MVSLALDSSGELVVAGSEDSFEIFLWSMQTGKLLDVLAGHEGPVTSLAFSPSQAGFLASGSWDKTYVARISQASPCSEPCCEN